MAREKRSAKPVKRYDNEQGSFPSDSPQDRESPIDEGFLGPEDYFIIGGTADA